MDQKLLFLINRQWTSPLLDWLMAALSSSAAWIPATAVLTLVFLIFGGFRFRAYLLTVALIVGFNDGVITRSLKAWADRPRPHQVFDDVRQIDLARAKPRFLALLRPPEVRLSRATIGEVEGRSFPSGHTMNCFSGALVTLAFYGRRFGWCYVLATLVGYSRIYNGSHWPSDVLVSIVLGTGATLLLLGVAASLYRALGRRFAPEMWTRHPALYGR